MGTKRFGKLVRDKIPAIIAKNGATPKVRTLSREGFKRALLEKLVEEAIEVRAASSSDELLVELADVSEVFLAILDAHAIDQYSLERLRKQRVRARGGFANKIFLESVKM